MSKRPNRIDEGVDEAEDTSMPTLGDVAKAERFAPLRGMLTQVAETPVDQLGENLRGGLTEDAQRDGVVRLMQAFFDACAAEEKKRRRTGSEEEPGERSKGCVSPSCSLCSFPHLATPQMCPLLRKCWYG